MRTFGAGDPYLSFTCHFSDPQWKLKSVCLSTQYLLEDHTAVNIEESLEETMHQWNLNKSNMVAITTDSGANVKSVCALLGCQRLSCFGHNLNLAVEKGLDDMRVKRA